MRKVWRFTNPATGESWYEEYPASRPDFIEYRGRRKGRLASDPVILLNGVELVGMGVTLPAYDPTRCTRGCRMADPNTSCVCPCWHENHGIENKRVAETAEPMEIICVDKA